ncbi:Apolipoprotein L3 [Anabarilius grahami]|uniref:Apolipoprotein L3 n=1 Tax=Anabarilius grahami TaxID=495550 RepID=A0A3N0YCG1_ANAGA|nr:Apolipoprotein L3 [Anabarilius grahami]
MKSAVVLMLFVTLVLSDGWDNGTFSYDKPEMFPDKPCQKSKKNNAYNIFTQRHILQVDFDTNSIEAWAKYLTTKKLCGRTKTKPQSFLHYKDTDRIKGICNNRGTIKEKNLCISDETFNVFIVQSSVRKGKCEVSLSKGQYYVIVACDVINNRCLPVHYDGQNKKRPSKPDWTYQLCLVNTKMSGMFAPQGIKDPKDHYICGLSMGAFAALCEGVAEMDHHHSHSSDDSGLSDHSMEHPPSFNRNLNLELKRSIEELKSEFGRNHQTLIGQIKKLNDITDEVESVHKNTTVGSLVGSSIEAVGGIASIAGLVLAPFTLGASLALTGVGAVTGVAGGVTGATSNITNAIKQKNLRETIEKIINDIQNTVKPMRKLLGKITEDIELVKKTLNKLEIQRAERGVLDVLKIAKVANVADIGKTCAEAAKEIRVYVKAVKAMRGSAQAAKAVRGSAQAAKAIRMDVVFAGGVSALFLALDVYSIVKDATELFEMNQSADKRKAEDIKSETLTFILHMRETAAQFEKIVDKIKDTIDTFF